MTYRISLAMLFFAGALSAQDEAEELPPPKPLYQFKKDHDPNGTGKFYMDREIAQVMSYLGASWLERTEREKEEHASKLLPPLKIKPGDAVADIGAGSGFYTMKLADAVGPKGKVYAVDIQPEMLDIIKKRVKAANVTNVELVHNTVTELKLPANSIDLMFLVDVYHEFSHPFEMTEEMVKALKPGGRVVFVEFRLEDEKVPILEVHRMSEKQVKREMAGHMLKHTKTLNHLPWQHVIIFEKIVESKPRINTDDHG
ncbi:MAG: class I SAM-dependent methyltransferase [Gemmataceae bacterium]|nr:class I SAM-dependent methyltransferase [Gemmataceae bacterium]MCI0737569.1 class I SAM-dependent methyltransferase [Gemmataceae bacterium]